MSYEHWRQQLGRCAPTPVRKWLVSGRLARLRRRNASRPVEEVFSEIYSSRRWGEGDEFDSGSGSRGEAATSYTTYVRHLIGETDARSAVDIGCGDFRVAAQFVDALESYEGLDIVKTVVERNTELHGRPGVRFTLMDVSVEDPPDAEICLIRQVLQHLSNAEIAAILDRCRKYPLVVITEHQPSPDIAGQPNVDKPHGPDTRLDVGSWVDISRPPFDCSPVSEVLRVPAPRVLYHDGETLATHVWRPGSMAPSR
jgi:hypothetical protein